MNLTAVFFALLITAQMLCAFERWTMNKMDSQVKQLIERIEGGDNSAILELGLLGDKSVIPYLEKLLQQSNKNFGSAASNAQMALAKLGVREQFDRILHELKSEDPALQDNAIKKLVYVGGPESVRTLVNLLDNTKYRSPKGFDPNKRGPHGEHPAGRELYEPLSYLAMKALAQLVPNPPLKPDIQPTSSHLRIWRDWWERNKSSYQR